MDREQVLREKTHKDDGIDTCRRVFYTLTDGSSVLELPLATDRTAKLLSLLIEHLEKTGKLSPGELDQLLLSTV